MAQKIRHTIYTYKGWQFTAHCGLEFNGTAIDTGEIRADVIQSTSTLLEIRKITCDACMRKFVSLLNDNSWQDWSKVQKIFGERLAIDDERLFTGC